MPYSRILAFCRLIGTDRVRRRPRRRLLSDNIDFYLSFSGARPDPLKGSRPDSDFGAARRRGGPFVNHISRYRTCVFRGQSIALALDAPTINERARSR